VAAPSPNAAPAALATTRLGPQHLTDLKALSASAVMLLLISTLALAGPTLGARLARWATSAHLFKTGAPLKVAQSWAELLGGTIAATTTFLVGRYANGPKVAVAPLEYCPPLQSIVRTPEQRRLWLGSGIAQE